MTRLQDFFSQHETTDDTTNIDYDYSLEEDEESSEPTHFTLPLVPILSDNESNLSAVNESASSTVRYEIELNEYSFRQSNGTDSSSPAPSSVVIDLLNQQQETTEDRNELMNITSIDLSTKKEDEESSSNEPDENSNAPHWYEEDKKNINSSENDTTTAESLEQTDTESPETTSPDSRDISNSDEDENYSTTSGEFVINKSEGFDERAEADKTISNRSDTTAIHLDDYFDTILLNDSLLIDETSSYENTTGLDFDVTTITAFSPSASTDSEESTNGSNEKKREENTTDVDRVITSTADFQFLPTTTNANSRKVEFTSQEFPYENRIIKDDQQDSNSENIEETNKFIYHHVPATDSAPTTVVRFPAAPARETTRGQRVRFPDESPSRSPPTSMSFAWPREPQQPGGLLRFWQEQPLINDFKFFSRGNSRAPSGNFNRPMSYRRNYR